MAVTHTLGLTYRSGAGSVTSANRTITSETENNSEVAIPATTTNKAITLAIDVSTIQSMMLYSDKAVTIKTNSTSEPDDTIALAAGRQIQWCAGDLADCPFSVDVTALYITNAGSTEATFKLYLLLDTAS